MAGLRVCAALRMRGVFVCGARGQAGPRHLCGGVTTAGCARRRCDLHRRWRRQRAQGRGTRWIAYRAGNVVRVSRRPRRYSGSHDSRRGEGARPPMTFARRVFLGAAIYGLIVLLPQYFLEEKTGRDFPPPITHVEYYYGFIGVAVAWQIVFLIIS